VSAAGETGGTGSERQANVDFVNSLLETEIAQRNARKEAQETTARWIVASAGVVLTLLLGLANNAGVYNAGTSTFVLVTFVLAVALGAGAAASAVGVIWPREYERLGGAGLEQLNTQAFLDQERHAVTGAVAATRIGIARRMDDLHTPKAFWLQLSLGLLVAAFLALLALGVALVGNAPASKKTTTHTTPTGTTHTTPTGTTHTTPTGTTHTTPTGTTTLPRTQ
jgi:hypothetical protein